MKKLEKDVIQKVDMDNDGKITDKVPSTFAFTLFFLLGFKLK